LARLPIFAPQPKVWQRQIIRIVSRQYELSRGEISISPVARTLLKARASDAVDVRTPAGVDTISHSPGTESGA
jgi:hypothetical protein